MSKIALIEPFFTGSHKKWAIELSKYSKHEIHIFELPGRFWKWRMHAGAISLSKQVLESHQDYDIFLVSDFLDLGLFKSLVVSNYPKAKFYIYFHENQITYPWSPTDQDVILKRDNHYAFINYASALVADKIFFNSMFHKKSFMASLPQFLKQFPDEHNLWSIEIIQNKSKVLPLALELPVLKSNIQKIENSILWNHRWEYDKNPETFFKILKNIKDRDIKFKLIVLGEKTNSYPKIFDWAKDYFNEEILHFGFASSREVYWNWLQRATILPVTSNQDFFGISIIEAIYAGVYPLLPNRLVYPEHILEKDRKIYLYETEDDLENRLKILLKDHNKNRRKSVSPQVSHYNWENSIEMYDLLLGD